MKNIIFFADAHLNPTQPDKTRFLIDFLNTRATDSDFYILGDLFDLWIGPGHIRLMEHAEILKAFRKLTSAGVNISFIPGNRDYMVGKELTDACGVNVLPEIAALTLPDLKIMLTHGDLLCTDDISYQNYRRVFRSGLVKSVCKSLPHSVGSQLGKGLKNIIHKTDDDDRILPSKSIVMTTLKRYFRQSYDAIICGHLHTAQQTQLTVAGKPKQLVVVGSLGEVSLPVRGKDSRGDFRFSYARYTDGKLELITS